MRFPFTARLLLVGVFAVLIASHTRAEIVYFDFGSGFTADSNHDLRGIGNIDLAGSGSFVESINQASSTPHLLFRAAEGMDFEPPRVWMAGNNYLNVAKDGEGRIAKLDSGTAIDSGWASWTSGYENPSFVYNEGDPWDGGATAYVGLRLGTVGDYNYGWGLMTYDADAISLTLYGLGFEFDPNTGINAGAMGAIPEPATSALWFTLSVGALVIYRRHRCAGKERE